MRIFSEKNFGVGGTVHRWWNSARAGIPLWICFAMLSVYWIFEVPSPGKAVGVLAVVAGIMSVREIKIMGKISWVILLVCLLMTEFRAIDKDRSDNEVKQRDFFNAQQAGFGAITTQATNNFNTTTSGLKSAVEGLSQNLQVASETLLQTAPHAQLVAGPFSVANAPVPPAMFQAGTDYEFDFPYVNNGNQQAEFLFGLGEMFVGKPRDTVVESFIKEQFEKSWDQRKEATKPQVIPAPSQQFWSAHRIFSDEEVKKIVYEGNTVYVVSRIKYRDSTGTWQSDRCDYYQVADNQLWIHVLHSCFILMNDRYSVKPH
jgi:hypothetical protein